MSDKQNNIFINFIKNFIDIDNDNRIKNKLHENMVYCMESSDTTDIDLELMTGIDDSTDTDIKISKKNDDSTDTDIKIII